MAKKKEHPAPPVKPVHLVRKWNLEPPVYLTIIWAALIIAVFYVVAILPGQIKSGRYYTISSPVVGSAIYLDGEYLGSGTITEFVPSGDHTLTYSFRGIASEEEILNVRGKILFTHLFPKKYQKTGTYYLNEEDLGAYYESLFEDVVTHSAILSYDTVYHYPPLFSFAAQTAVNGKDSHQILSFLQKSAYFITSEEMRKDYSDSLDFLKEHGLDTSALASVTEKLAQLTYEQKSTRQTVSDLIPESASMIDTLTYDRMEIHGFRYDGGSFTEGRPVTETSYPGVQELQRETSVNPFILSESEISEYQYALFLEENPSWAKDQKETLIKAGLVDGILP